MKKIVVGLGILVLMFVAGVVLSPYYALYQAKKNIETGNIEPVLAMVDYQAVQTGVAKTLHTRFDETLTGETFIFLKQLAPNFFADVKTKVAGEIDTAVAGAITPDNLGKLLKNDISRESKALATVWVLSSNYVDFGQLIKDSTSMNDEKLIVGQLPIIQQKAQKRYGKPLPAKPVLSYCGYDCFYVAGAVKELPVGVYLRREGLFDWKINKVELP